VTFAWPAVLLALALVAAGVGAYLARQRRARRLAEQAASAALVPSLAPRRPGWRRHVPYACYALALALLVVAVARPQATVAVPIERATVLLVLDDSNSMLARDVAPTRLAAGRAAAEHFLDDVPPGARIGVVAFNRRVRVLQSPTDNRDAVRLALAQLRAAGGTNTGDALEAALDVLVREPRVAGRRPPAAIVLISDGARTGGEDPIAQAQRARGLGVPVHTVAYGTAAGTIRVPAPGGGTRLDPVPPDPASLREIARASGGRAFQAEDSEQLAGVYDALGAQLVRRQERREVSQAFVGGALALVAAGAALSLTWFARRP
jgi:Ca-activated chloride channel family protein